MKFNIPEYLKEDEKKKREREIAIQEELDYIYEVLGCNLDEDAGDRI